MTEDHRALIDQARAEHTRCEREEVGECPDPSCLYCADAWPCLTVRLAEALEHSIGYAINRAANLRLKLAAAERRVAELEDALKGNVSEDLRVECVRLGLENIALAQSLVRDLAAAERERAENFSILTQQMEALGQGARELAAARGALEGVRRLTALVLPSEQTGPEWERCVRVPVVWMAGIDAAVDAVLGDPPVTDEPKPPRYLNAASGVPTKQLHQGSHRVGFNPRKTGR